MITRRGLSTVVGAVFAVIVITTSIGYVTYSLNLLDQYNKSVLARNQLSIDKGSENFQVYSFKVVNNKFNITIANTGNLPINITRMWVQNTTANIDWVNYYTINKAVNPGALITNIGQNSPVYANTANPYNVKLVTSRGNSIQFSMGSTNSKPLYVQLTMIPPNPSAGRNVTLYFVVINNMSSNNALVNLTPNTPTCKGVAASFSKKIGPLPSSYPTLPSGGIAIFKWIYQNNAGVSGNSATCTVNLVNGVFGNNGTDFFQLN